MNFVLLENFCMHIFAVLPLLFHFARLFQTLLKEQYGWPKQLKSVSEHRDCVHIGWAWLC